MLEALELAGQRACQRSGGMLVTQHTHQARAQAAPLIEQGGVERDGACQLFDGRGSAPVVDDHDAEPRAVPVKADAWRQLRPYAGQRVVRAVRPKMVASSGAKLWDELER